MSNKQAIQQLRTQGTARAGQFIARNPNFGNQQPFRDSTFLFIRSFDTDIGERSPGILDPRGSVFWLSPAITLYDRGGESLDRLVAGEEYLVDVDIQNNGDLNAYTCTIELYLCDPSLGFSLSAPSTSFLGLQPAAVMSGATTTVRFPFVASAPNIGHKCMFARVHSVVNREIPAVVSTLDPFHNRHDAQQNLVIAMGGEIVAFSLALPEPQANNLTMFVQAVSAVKHLPKKLRARNPLKSLAFITVTKAATFEDDFLVLPVVQQAGLAFAPGAPLQKITRAIASRYGFDYGSRPSTHILVRGQSSWTFSMNGTGALRAFFIVPRIGLRKGESAVFRVLAMDRQQRPAGGITLIVKG